MVLAAGTSPRPRRRRPRRLAGLVLTLAIAGCPAAPPPALPVPARPGDAADVVWSQRWEVLVNAESASSDGPTGGWHEGAIGPAFGVRPPYEGPGIHEGVLVLHPLSAAEPARIWHRARVDAGAPVLWVEVAAPVGGDTVLACVADGAEAGVQVIDGLGWQLVGFDLSDWAGREVDLQLVVAPGGDETGPSEHAFVDRVFFGAPP